MDETKIIYTSNWDIDQISVSQTKTIASGDTILETGLEGLPVFEVQFRPTGHTGWYLSGNNLVDGSLGTSFSFYSYLQGGNLRINTTTGGSARYYIWSDKVDV